MSRAVCGVCFCPYGDEGDCACQPAPPPECKTDEEKTAFAFGWWKALEENRKQPAPATELREQQEPVAWMWKDGTVTADPDRADGTWIPLYTSPPASKTWVGLTDEEIRDCNNAEDGYVFMWREDLEDGGLPFARAIEAKLKEKNA